MYRPKHVEWTCKEINFTAHCRTCWLFHRMKEVYNGWNYEIINFLEELKLSLTREICGVNGLENIIILSSSN